MENINVVQYEPANDADVAYMEQIGNEYPMDIVSRYQTLPLIARIRQLERDIQSMTELLLRRD